MSTHNSTSVDALRFIAIAYLRPLVYARSLIAGGIRKLWPTADAAAVNVLLGVVLVAFLLGVGSFGKLYDEPVDYRTAQGETRVQKLPDGSTMELAPLTDVRVRYVDRMRAVTLLKGEAYFAVAHDSARPFQVRVGNRIVRAVGTAFNVNDRPGQTAEVLVTEGRVAVFNWVYGLTHTVPDRSVSVGERRSLPLQETDAGSVREVSDQEMRRRLAWRDGRIISGGETLGEIVEKANLFGSQQLVIDDPSISGLRIGGAFSATETRAIVAALKTLGVRARTVKRGGVEEIHLSGDGSLEDRR
jgi:transmembrane sensor